MIYYFYCKLCQDKNDDDGGHQDTTAVYAKDPYSEDSLLSKIWIYVRNEGCTSLTYLQRLSVGPYLGSQDIYMFLSIYDRIEFKYQKRM